MYFVAFPREGTNRAGGMPNLAHKTHSRTSNHRLDYEIRQLFVETNSTGDGNDVQKAAANFNRGLPSDFPQWVLTKTIVDSREAIVWAEVSPRFFPKEREQNRLFSYSRYWTGTSLQPRLMRGVFSNANAFISF